MRALITGGAGFIGSHIVDNLVGRGHEVLVVDDLSTGKLANLAEQVALEEIDVADQALQRLVTSFKPDLITHCAAQASVPASMADPAFDASTNIVGGINVCNAAIAADCHRFIYVTTGGALYGTPKYLPCDEQHPIQPESAYGLSKWTLEQYLAMLLPATVNLQILRLANVYGPRQDPHGEAGVVAIFAEQMLRGKQVKIFGDGEQTRDFVYVSDVAAAHDRAITTGDSAVVNIGTEIATTINQIYELISTETSYQLRPVYEPERAGDVKHVVLANGKADRELGWQPNISLADGIRETVDWFRSQA